MCIRNGVAWLKLYRKSLFQTIRFPEGKVHEDTFVMPFIYDQAKTVVYTDAVIYYYLVRLGSITGTYHLNGWISWKPRRELSVCTGSGAGGSCTGKHTKAISTPSGTII